MEAHRATLLTTYGAAGIPLLTALACICWNVWLIIVTIHPNATANYLMNTGEFDNGTFWLIIDPSVTLSVFGVLGLTIVLLSYVFVLVRMRWQLSRLAALTVIVQDRMKIARQPTMNILSSMSPSNQKLRRRLRLITRFYSYAHKSQVLLRSISDMRSNST